MILPAGWHNGQLFDEPLHKKSFEADELGGGAELTDEMFFGYYFIIRANGNKIYKSFVKPCNNHEIILQ